MSKGKEEAIGVSEFSQVELVMGELGALYNKKAYVSAKEYIESLMSDKVKPHVLRSILLISKGLKKEEILTSVLAEVEGKLILMTGSNVI